MKISLLLMITMLVVTSFELSAKCPNISQFQTIEIVPNANGKPMVVDKSASTKCEIRNNKLTSRQSTSHIKWVFRRLNCSEQHCKVSFKHENEIIPNTRTSRTPSHPNSAAPNPNLPIKARQVIDEAMTCEGNPQYYVCTLRVNELKRYCEKFSTTSTTSCTMDYDIIVNKQTIDPSIIIKPRPLN